jgi:outer membrane protein assembly factor BamB
MPDGTLLKESSGLSFPAVSTTRSTMRALPTTLVLCAMVAGTLPLAHGQRALPVPVHPDTLPTLELSWRLPASLAPLVTNTFAPRMALSGMLLYVFDHHGRRLVAVDATTGKVTWHTPVPSASDRTFALTPLVARERVFVATDGYVYAFDAVTGRSVWTQRTKGVAVNGLARSKHHLLLPWINVTGTQAQPGVHLWAIDSRNGAVEWSRKLPGDMAYVLGDADGAYYVANTGVVLGLTPDRGDPKWQARVKGEVVEPPILSKGVVYVATRRKKAGWSGTGLSALDAAKGTLLWETKLPSTLISKFLVGDQFAVVEANGRLTRFDSKGARTAEVQLGFGDEPTDLVATAVGNRAYVFSHHADGNGYIRLVDLDKKKVIATANAPDLPVRSVVPAAKLLFLDGTDGYVYSIRLDRSQRPKRATVPPEEFAREMLDRAAGAKSLPKGLALKLAGLGQKALAAIEPALQSPDPVVVEVAAQAVGLIGSKHSVPALIKAVARLEAAQRPSEARSDPLVTIVDAVAEMRDGRAVAALQKLMKDEGQSHLRRRAAYVALGAIGSPVSLAPIWAFRAAKQVSTMKWDPQAFTPSYDFQVETDVETSAASWPDLIRRETSITIQNKGQQTYTAAISPYLGGYNDIWLGRSDLSGILTTPFFTGITRPEMTPGKRLRFKELSVSEKGEVSLVMTAQDSGRAVASRPVKLTLAALATDSDGDKLPDVIEQRLHTCLHNPDCDGDGIKDAEDLNPLASGKVEPTVEQRLFREAFFTFYAFLKRRGIVVVDPGDGPSFEVYGRQDPVLSLRRPTVEKLRKETGLHAVDYVSFGGPYPEGSGYGDALAQVVWNKKKTEATVGMDVFRSGDNAVGYNVTLKKVGKSWVAARFFRVWTTN